MKLIYPMKNVRLTQGSYGAYSHKNKKAIDLAGKDLGKDPIFSPCDGMVVVAINDKYVLCEVRGVIELTTGGALPYISILFYHETADPGIKVGQVLKLKQTFMHEGKKGWATGNHVHIRIRDVRGVEILPEQVFWFDPNYHKLISNSSKYPIVKLQEEEYEMDPQDANKIIAFLKAGYAVCTTQSDKNEYHRLANEIRKASGQKTT